MWTQMFYIICLCNILCDTSKASENPSFVLKQSHSVECFCCHRRYLLSACHQDQRLCRTNDVGFISTLWCAWGSKCNFWSRGRLIKMMTPLVKTRYERFYSVRSNYARAENLVFEDVRKSAAKCLRRNFRVWRRRLTREHISNNIPTLMYFVMLITHSVNVHLNTRAN